MRITYCFLVTLLVLGVLPPSGCVVPHATTTQTPTQSSATGDQKQTTAAPTNQGAIQVATTYADGDIWVYRMAVVGAVMITGIVCWSVSYIAKELFCKLHRSRPVDGLHRKEKPDATSL